MKRSVNFKVLMITLGMALTFTVVGANVFIVSVFGYHLNSGTNIGNEIKGIHKVDQKLLAERGRILDRNGVVLAQDVIAYTLSANIDTERVAANGDIAHINDKEAAAEIIGGIIGQDPATTLAHLNTDAKQVEFGYEGKYITSSMKAQLEESGLKGLGFTQVRTREYPNTDETSKLIGNTYYDDEDDKLKGAMGIEQLYDNELSGTNGYEKYQQDRDGYKLYSTIDDRKEPKNGQDVQLTLDANIQRQLDESLRGITEDPGVKATAAWGLVMEAKTGRILAWGEYPGFDPNKEGNVYEDRVGTWTYEPGSTMKTFTVASAIEEGVWDDAAVYDTGPFHVGEDANGNPIRLSSPENATNTITNANESDSGMYRYDYGYAVSSNVMIAEMLSNQLKYDVYQNYLTKLRFFQPIEIDRVQTSEGYFNPDDMSPASKLSRGYGHALTVNSAQIAQAYTTVMTDGSLIKPYIIDSFTDPVTKEKVQIGKTQNLGRVYSPETAAHMRDLMRQVVTTGSARRFDSPDVEVIAKTGTAQYVENGVYSKEDYIFSSVQGFPYNDPEVIVYTSYAAKYGHDVDYSAVHVNKIVKAAVNAMNVSQANGNSVIEAVKPTALENYTNTNAVTAEESVKSHGLTPVRAGNGSHVIKQFPLPETNMIANERVILYTGGSEIVMPDMTGWSHKEVTSFMSMTGYVISIEGSGYVASQSVAAGTVLSADTTISVKLS